MKRRQFLAAAGAATSGALLGGCARTGSYVQDGKIPIYGTVATWSPGFEKVSPVLKRASGYGISAVPAPDLGSYEQVLKSRLQTSQAPDVFKWWNGYRLRDTARSGKLTDLTELWDAYAAKDWIDTGVKDGLTHDGHVYGLPLTQSYYVMFYSKKLFAKYDLRVPDSWDELLDAAETLKANGVTPFFSTQNGSWPALIWFQELVSKLDPDFYVELSAGRASYTDPTVREALDLWRRMIEKEYFTSPDVDQNNAPAMMRSGQVAMYPIGTWSNQALSATGMKPGRDYDAFLLPTIRSDAPPSLISEVAALAVPSNAPDKRATMRMMAHWLDPDVQRTWMSFLGDIPPNPTVSSPDPIMRRVQQQVRQTQPRLLIRYWEASPPSLIEGNVQDLGGFMIEPDRIDSIVESMRRRADSEWDYWREAI